MTYEQRTVVSNVLVIGSGGAGCRAAIEAHNLGSDVVIVGKRAPRDAHTVLAAGGINAALGTVDPEDSWQQHFADTLKEGVYFGAMAFDLQTGERTVYLADAVVLCAGGHTRLWRRSSSRRDENTGDGMYLALPAGAELADMELSTRDRVAMANYTEIVEGRGGPNSCVFLDTSHRDKDFILQKIPRIHRQFLEAQLLDISKSPMEVAPTAHYTMGGVVVDPDEVRESAARADVRPSSDGYQDLALAIDLRNSLA